MITGPWSPGASTTMIQTFAALSDDSKCSCAWTGSIEITDPGSEIEID